MLNKPLIAMVGAGAVLLGAIAVSLPTRDASNSFPRGHEIKAALDRYLKEHNTDEETFLAYRRTDEREVYRTVSALLDIKPDADPYEVIGNLDNTLKARASETAKPPHYFAYDDGQGHYGYTVPVSDADRAQGIGSHPYAMMSFWRMDNNDRVYVFGTSNMRGQIIYRCEAPCTSVSARSVTTGGQDFMPVTEGTILWEFVQDMLSGQIKGATGAIY